MICRPPITACTRVDGSTKSLAVLVRSYAMHNRPRLRDELRYFAGLSSLERVIEAAALATDARGKRLDHQRRLTRAALVRAKANLLAALPKLRKCQSFEVLHTLIDGLVRGIRGLGELYVYDTSLRIGGSPGFVAREGLPSCRHPQRCAGPRLLGRCFFCGAS